jgi:O-antigen ligase
MFGLFFAMLGPVCAGILGIEKRYRTLYVAALCLLSIGVFASMSSGPMLAALLAMVFIALYRYRKSWKVITAVIVLMCGLVEIISNRHFYDVLGSYTLSSRSAWYRSKIIDVALFEGGMSGHWFTGFGYNTDPGWSANIDNRDHTDVVNHYLLVLCRFGLVGLVPFLAMNIVVVKQLVDAYRASMLRSDKWLIWCLAAGLIGLAGALMSIALFDQSTTVYYILIGFAGVMPAIMIETERQDFVKPDLSYHRLLTTIKESDTRAPFGSNIKL